MSAVAVAGVWVAASVALAVVVATVIKASAGRDVAEEAEAYLRSLTRRRPHAVAVGVRSTAVVVLIGTVVAVSYRTVGDVPGRIISAARAPAHVDDAASDAAPADEDARPSGSHTSRAEKRHDAALTTGTTRPGTTSGELAAGAGATAGVATPVGPPGPVTTSSGSDSATAERPPSVARGTTTTTTAPDASGTYASPRTTTTTTTAPEPTTTTSSPPESTTTTTTSPPESTTTTTTTSPPESTTTTTTSPPESTTTTTTAADQTANQPE